MYVNVYQLVVTVNLFKNYNNLRTVISIFIGCNSSYFWVFGVRWLLIYFFPWSLYDQIYLNVLWFLVYLCTGEIFWFDKFEIFGFFGSVDYWSCGYIFQVTKSFVSLNFFGTLFGWNKGPNQMSDGIPQITWVIYRLITGQSSNSAPVRVKGILNQSVYLKKIRLTQVSNWQKSLLPSLYVRIRGTCYYYYGIILIK